MDHDEILAAMNNRHAVRRYLDRPIPPNVRDRLDEDIERCNSESGLAIRAFYDEPEGFRGGLARYGAQRGVRNYVALGGPVDTEVDAAVGYYGEQIALLAQHLGLNTCWVGLSYNKRKLRAKMAPGEKLALVIATGYGENQGKPHKSKPIEKLGRVRDGSPMPEWFRRGLEVASLAPTGLNQQKFSFILDGDKVRAVQGAGAYTAIDLGIAKYHFEVGTESNQWRWA